MNKLNYFIFYYVCILLSSIFINLSFGLSFAAAQSNERFKLEYQQFSDADDVSASFVSGRFSHRMFLDNEGSNLLTLSLGVTQVDLTDDQQTGPDRNRQLKSFVSEINLLKVLNENYSLVATLRPGFYGDLNGSLSDEFRLEGGAVITRFINSNLTLGLGLGRGTNFGRDLVVPLVQFLYFASDKIVLSGVLPVKASAWYIPSQKWEFGFIYELLGTMYHLDETNISGAKRIGFAAAQLGLATNYKIFGNHFITAEVGYAVIRRYQWDDSNGTSFDIGGDPFLERDLDPAAYLRVGFMQKL